MNYNIMKPILHIIERDSLFGLANNFGIEVVECVYDHIKPLINGKFIVIKDKMAGILDSDGKILFYPQANRIQYIKGIDIFHYKVKAKWSYFTFINGAAYYISVDKIRFDEKLQIINVWKDGLLKVYNDKFVEISTGYEQIEPTDLRRNNSRFYLGKKSGMWGVFRIKRQRKHALEAIVIQEAVYRDSEAALLALKNTALNHRRIKNITAAENKKSNN